MKSVDDFRVHFIKTIIGLLFSIEKKRISGFKISILITTRQIEHAKFNKILRFTIENISLYPAIQ